MYRHRLSFAIAVLALAACGKAGGPAAPIAGDVLVTIEQRNDDRWRVAYELAAPRAELDLGPDIDGYRGRHWAIASEGAALIRRDGRDVVVPAGGRRRIRSARFLVEPAASDRRKDYEPFIPMGDGGFIVYTGHFIPYKDASTRLDARLTIIADEGASVSAFDETKKRFENWKSPYGHPGFVYVGAAAPIETDALLTIADATAPAWVKAEVASFAPTIAGALQGLFARALPAKPNIFVAMGDQGGEGRLSYSGDALPGQYQMTLAGGAWAERTDEALGVLRLSTAHEAAHLWLAAARPRTDAVPDWIHEGGADALAAEALAAAGYWSAAEKAARFETAKAECARGLQQLSLARAESENRWEAVYACGHVISVAAAGEAGVAAFWREFVRRSGRDGYDEAMFLALAEERAGALTVNRIRDLVRINAARPDLSIARMLERAPDLAAGEGR
ncbi:MAG: hypothetical protein HXY21_08265 [Parvularculaceae bacterium]|nr:hypothetical protein [Parvularculaceae bacterium]